MNLTNSQYDRLMAGYSQRRQRASAGLDERRIKVYADIPELRDQAFAWAFGASLKKEYDPEGIDRLTERIVLMVEAGQL